MDKLPAVGSRSDKVSNTKLVNATQNDTVKQERKKKIQRENPPQYEPATLGVENSVPGLVVSDVRRKNVVEPLYELKTRQFLIDFPALEPLDCHCNNGDGRDCCYAYECKQERHVWRDKH